MIRLRLAAPDDAAHGSVLLTTLLALLMYAVPDHTGVRGPAFCALMLIASTFLMLWPRRADDDMPALLRWGLPLPWVLLLGGQALFDPERALLGIMLGAALFLIAYYALRALGGLMADALRALA